MTTTSSTSSTTNTTTSANNHPIPPYWQPHQRNPSTLSHASVNDLGRPTPIVLEDHTVEDSEQSRALWAKSVSIDDYVVVSGNVPGVGAYVVWNCTVRTLDGGPMKIRKRYSEFDSLRTKLAQTFPNAAPALPQLPPKSTISRFRPRFLERRKVGLSYFLKYVISFFLPPSSHFSCVLLNPEFAGSPVLKEFLFS
ncbi:Phox-like protein [Saccharata proteae CBS 121410]|uniref:Endosomal/vacuolar adapter protein YPT35 n=1 Tax=Saccharata proteae CBS 121410 TaxID=1314787 RepID=A0A9P4M0Y2_9PEZI|nr:Phox-like protein [Saccharata proteae CBS 121410]